MPRWPAAREPSLLRPLRLLRLRLLAAGRQRIPGHHHRPLAAQLPARPVIRGAAVLGPRLRQAAAAPPAPAEHRAVAWPGWGRGAGRGRPARQRGRHDLDRRPAAGRGPGPRRGGALPRSPGRAPARGRDARPADRRAAAHGLHVPRRLTTVIRCWRSRRRCRWKATTATAFGRCVAAMDAAIRRTPLTGISGRAGTTWPGSGWSRMPADSPATPAARPRGPWANSSSLRDKGFRTMDQHDNVAARG